MLATFFKLWLGGRIFEKVAGPSKLDAPGKYKKLAPLGPVLATPEEIPADAQLTTELDGEVMQRGDIHDLVHDPVSLVQYISTITTLRPGDIVLTGTPGGVGHARTPQRYLAPGNSVTITVDGIGSLTNDFAAEERG